jgi:glycosyltransferase involved in cell wall biosynthesis
MTNQLNLTSDNDNSGKLHLMMLGDDPNKETGFARVMRNLLNRWVETGAFETIRVWGIGYWGMPHQQKATIYPAAGPDDSRWESRGNLQRLVTTLTHLPITHLFMVQDMWAVNPLAKVLAELREKKGLKTYLYFPVDAPLEPEWTPILEASHESVAYTEYGREMAASALERAGEKKSNARRKELATAVKRLRVIPHGVDPAFRPLPTGEKGEARMQLFRGKVRDHDFLMVNVNTNQRRKGVPQSLQILAELKELREEGDPEFRLYLHMPRENRDEGICLGLVARQLGLIEGEDVFFGDPNFVNGRPILSDEGLNRIYNAADLYLTTSLGEGWGLGVTEAMAAGTPVAGPAHTSLAELIENRGLELPLLQPDVVPGDNSRLRSRVNASKSAELILEAVRAGYVRQCTEAAREFTENLDWDEIAAQWMDLFFDHAGAAV